jgi:hypothetical protein
MKSGEENLKQENTVERLKEVRIDARTTAIAQELQALTQELVRLKGNSQENAQAERRTQDRILKNRDYLASLHEDGFRELLPEDSYEILQSEAKRLSLEISLREAEFRRLQKSPLTSNGMFVRSKDEPKDDAIVRKKESLILIQTALIQREDALSSNQAESTPLVIDQTMLQDAEDLDQRLSEFASSSSANETYDPELRKLITLRREVNGVASEIDTSSCRLERLQRNQDDLNYNISVSTEETEYLRQKNSADIKSLYSNILTLTKRLSRLVEEEQQEINRHLKKLKEGEMLVAN